MSETAIYYRVPEAATHTQDVETLLAAIGAYQHSLPFPDDHFHDARISTHSQDIVMVGLARTVRAVEDRAVQLASIERMRKGIEGYLDGCDATSWVGMMLTSPVKSLNLEQMPEIPRVRIESTYLVPRDGSLLSALRDAAVSYDQTRPVGENFMFDEGPSGEEMSYVVYGRSVVEAVDYASVARDLDLMQTEIESLVTPYIDQSIITKGRCGLYLSGILPD
jgi:hypothetical protein